jgi:hypothetical protein
MVLRYFRLGMHLPDQYCTELCWRQGWDPSWDTPFSNSGTFNAPRVTPTHLPGHDCLDVLPNLDAAFDTDRHERCDAGAEGPPGHAAALWRGGDV